MTAQAFLQRKIAFKKQLIKFTKADIQKLRRQLWGKRLESVLAPFFLCALKNIFEIQTDDTFDPRLSRKLNCLVFLLEDLKK